MKLTTPEAENDSIISFQGQNCTFLVGDLVHQGGIIQALPDINQTISVCTGNNRSKIIGEQVTLNVYDDFTNEGDVILKHLSGDWKFINHKNIQFTGTQEEPSQISIRYFINGKQADLTSNDSSSSPARLTGSHIIVTPQNTKFITYDDSEIVTTNRLIFEKPETPSSTPLELKGNIHTDVLDIYRQEAINSGVVSARAFSAHGDKFLNAAKALLQVREAIEANVDHFQNDGEMVIEQGRYTQKWGEFINSGLWDQTGDIDSGITKFTNTGSLGWKSGRWTSFSQECFNNGTWVLDQMECSQYLTIHNYHTLHLKNSKLAFYFLINHQKLILSGGQYIVIDSLQNNGLMSFLEHDWMLTDDSMSTAPHRLVLQGEDAKKCHSAGEIEVEKNLSYDLQALPKLIRSEGDVIFSKRHGQSRTITDLEKVSANGKVSFYTPSIMTTQDYEFGNIGHLALYVDGLFTTQHSFKAPALTLEVDSPLICGASNQVMGIIAATKGPLTVTAHSVDGRFGKFYGAGPTVVKSTKGDILVGAAVQKGADFANRLGCAHEYNEIPGNVWVYTTVNDVNGAYISSNSTLDIEANSSLILDYGNVFSRGNATFAALKNISAIRGIIQGAGTAHWSAPSILFGRAPAEAKYLYMTPWYPNVISYAAKSGCGAQIKF